MLRSTAFILSTLIIFLLNSCQSSTPKEWQFVQLADTQLGMGGYEHDKTTFQAAIDEINEQNPFFTIICGDLVEKGTVESYNDFKQISSSFTAPYYCLPGNHDVVWEDKDLFSLYEEMITPQYYYEDLNGWRFVFVNTTRWKDKRFQDQNESFDLWLEETLSEAKAQNIPIIVAGHHPLFLAEANEDEEYFNLPTAKRQELFELFQENGVRAYLCGHLHQDSVLEHQGTLYVTCASTSRNFDKSPYGYRLWTVSKEGELDHQYIPIKIQPEPIPMEEVGKEK